MNFGAGSDFALGARSFFFDFAFGNHLKLKFKRCIAQHAVALQFEVSILRS